VDFQYIGRFLWDYAFSIFMLAVRFVDLPSTDISYPSCQEVSFVSLEVLQIIKYEARYLRQYSDTLRAGRSGDRIPVGTRFFAPILNGPGAHPASYTMGNGSFPGVKRSGRGVEHPPNLAPKLKKE
jgi:hypothetical protein